jgi:hypothetical protein
MELGPVTTPPEPTVDVDAVTPSVVEEVMYDLRAVNAKLRTATGGLDLRVLLRPPWSCSGSKN